MVMQSKRFRTVAVALTVILILAYALIVFIPHSHECVELHCAVCDTIKSVQKLISGAIIVIALCLAPKILFIATNAYLIAIKARDCTPVGLKVKLSD